MLSKPMLEALSRQINQEFSSSYYYLLLSGYCELNIFSGAAQFFRIQHQEELVHAMKLFDYVVKRRNGKLRLPDIRGPKGQIKSLLHAFEEALKNEKETTKGIYEVMDRAHDDRDYATITVLDWFAEEQAEEESLMEHYVEKLRLVGDDGSGQLFIDSELSRRGNPASADHNRGDSSSMS